MANRLTEVEVKLLTTLSRSYEPVLVRLDTAIELQKMISPDLALARVPFTITKSGREALAVHIAEARLIDGMSSAGRDAINRSASEEVGS